MAIRLIDVGLLAFALAIGARAYGYGLWSGEAPGDGLFPFLAAAGLFVVLLADIVRQGRCRRGAVPGVVAGVRGVATVSGLVLAYALVLPWAGFALATSVLLTVITRVADPRVRLRFALVVCSVLAVLTYVVFTRWLGVPLPPGLVGS